MRLVMVQTSTCELMADRARRVRHQVWVYAAAAGYVGHGGCHAVFVVNPLSDW